MQLNHKRPSIMKPYKSSVRSLSFVITTTEPNELAREVNDRMPVILLPEH